MPKTTSAWLLSLNNGGVTGFSLCCSDGARFEIPTPRWTTYDAEAFGVKLPEDVTASIQERTYTSPIWYTPKG